ncbi:acyltransferase [Lutimonas zeaxanthinifaciens]|uniref:acyltransferase n=1 Tax=Lutimonas zeaxanthinifaciens TaxID=3060215 RepID=UPI00265CE03D|nr:acyltransferase [Lutimonas sp. YSD2104]WKK67358.1 acyltransferase [Lutimonas sp. YSD2104]
MKNFLLKIYLPLKCFIDYLIREWLMYIPFHRFRKGIIKLQCKHVGKSTNFLMGIELRVPKNISVGNNSVINKNVLLDGRGGSLIIGSNVDIAQETNIWTLEHDIHDDYHIDRGGDVIIGDYVWIASRVTILPGVTIGKGAVVASNSVVTKDVPAMTIVGGIPAKVIGQRKSKLKYRLNYKPWFR